MICPRCGESLPPVNDAFCPYCRARLDAPDDEFSHASSLDETQRSRSADEPGPAERPVRITAWFLREFSKVFRSRDRILREVYLETLKESGESVPTDSSLGELRQDFIRVFYSESSPGLNQIEEQEQRIVFITRCINLWILFWMLILPTVSALFIGLYFDGPNPIQRILLVLLIWVILFPVLALAGLTTQQLFGRPFNALMNRVLKPPQQPK
jgi:hypothetical protein